VVPINLIGGAALLVLGSLNIKGVERFSDHLNDIGNGLLGSYTSAIGYAFGKRKKLGSALLHPYEGVPQDAIPPPHAAGDLSSAQMAAIVQRMQQAARAPAH
jgi:hypothetical protein